MWSKKDYQPCCEIVYSQLLSVKVVCYCIFISKLLKCCLQSFFVWLSCNILSAHIKISDGSMKTLLPFSSSSLEKYSTYCLWQVFRSSLHPPDYQSRLDIVRANSKTSLDRTGSFLTTSGTLQVRLYIQ